MRADLFFEKLVPEAWNESADLIEQMRGVDFGIQLRIQGAGESEFNLVVRNGEMFVSSAAQAAPLVRLSLSEADLEQLAKQVGPSPMALFGGMVKRRGFALTADRIEKLRALQGTIALHVIGPDSWRLLMHYGTESVPDAPQTTVSVTSETYAKIRNGELNLQGAFLAGDLLLEGDVDLALELAMCLV